MTKPKTSKKPDMGIIFQGRSCFRIGLGRDECPHAQGSDAMRDWYTGWDAEARKQNETSKQG